MGYSGFVIGTFIPLSNIDVFIHRSFLPIIKTYLPPPPHPHPISKMLDVCTKYVGRQTDRQTDKRQGRAPVSTTRVETRGDTDSECDRVEVGSLV